MNITNRRLKVNKGLRSFKTKPKPPLYYLDLLIQVGILCFILYVAFMQIVIGNSHPEWFISDQFKDGEETYPPQYDCIFFKDPLNYSQKDHKIMRSGEYCKLVDAPAVPYISKQDPILYWTIQNQSVLSFAIVLYIISYWWRMHRWKKIIS